MEDHEIVALYWARNERAIAESDQKYGAYCRKVAYNILRDREDSAECVNDTYLRAWDAMPPQRPSRLRAFLAAITRNLSLDRCRAAGAAKRGGKQLALALTELEEAIPSGGSVADDLALADLLDRFLAGLSPEDRKIFLRRYWYMLSVREIARGMGLGESKVKMSLLRSRRTLKAQLEREGYTV